MSGPDVRGDTAAWDIADQGRHGSSAFGAQVRRAIGLLIFVAMIVVLIGWGRAEAFQPRRITPFPDQWSAYKARFVERDGRVIDTGNHNISHTESQGTGMLFALFANDQASFDHIWQWTADHLQRADGLFAWKWDPRKPFGPADENNATDGDLMLAWALLMAGNLWDEASYIAAADTIVEAIETKIVEKYADRLILRPGIHGFDDVPGERVLNLSYCVFPALQEIAAHTKSDIWLDIYRDCLVFVKHAGFGDLALPIDWISFDRGGAVSPAPKRPARFGYDAIRVPLYLVWSGHNTPRYIDRFGKAWGDYPTGEAPPSWIDPFTGEHAEYRAANGFLAVRSLVELAIANNAKRLRETERPLPTISAQDDYYSASLIMFANLAASTLVPLD